MDERTNHNKIETFQLKTETYSSGCHMQSDGMVGMVLQPSGHPPHIKHATHLYTYEVNLV